ncbi:MAG: hypothetical protein IID40_04605 [Planctomycetes bacterium]|nr:hypothetical protein [Planctomycetota bacterium]
MVDMIYRGIGKADALFDGDRAQLREDIVRSAVEHPESKYFGRETLDALSKARENDLLFGLATNMPLLDYDGFDAISRKIGRAFLEDPEHGAERSRVLDETGGRLALNENK